MKLVGPIHIISQWYWIIRTDSIVSLNVYDLETTQAYLDSGVTGDELYALGASAGVILNNIYYYGQR
jgi:hypothetical protein